MARGASESGRQRIIKDMDVFRTACGAVGRLGVEVVDASRPVDPLQTAGDLPYLLIGRGSQCDIRLPDPKVSYRHAYVQQIGADVYCFDLASENGIRWNSAFRHQGKLEVNDELEIGPYHLQFWLADGPAADDARAEADAGLLTDSGVDLEPVTFEIWRGRRKAGEWTPRHPVTLVGQSESCSVRIKHYSVSRVHCSLVQTGRGVWAVDLLGRGGTRLDGEPISFAPLEPGESVEIGKFQIRVRYGSRRRSAGAARRSGGGTVLSPPSSSLTLADADPPSSLSVAADAASVPHDLVLSLVREFTAAQQQTVQQSHAMLLSAMQMMCQSQNAFLGEIRTQVLAIDRLTAELGQMRTQLESMARNLPVAPVPAVPAGTIEQATVAPPPVAESLPAPPTTIPVPEAAAENSTLPLESPAEIEEPIGSGARSEEAAPASAEDGNAEPEATGESSEALLQQQALQLHSELCERLGRMERERTNRWRKLMSSLTGMPERSESDYHTPPPQN